MYISFKVIENVTYPVMSEFENDKSSLEYDINNRSSMRLLISLLESYKGIFIILNECTEDKFLISKKHFSKKETSLYINRSYLSFWAKSLLDLDNFSVKSLFLSI